MKRETAVLRNYAGRYGVSADYCLVHEFLVECQNEAYSYARFDWMITHRPYLQEQFLNRIGLWEAEGKVVAADLYDTSLDDIFVLTLPGYEFLYEEMIAYASEHMVNEENPDFRLFIDDHNKKLQQVATQMGYRATEDKDKTAKYDLTKKIPDSHMKEGFQLVTLAKERDYDRYLHCLFLGFGHEERGEIYAFEEKDQKEAKSAYEREYVDLNLKVSVKTPDGSYAAHCGMWYDTDSKFSIIEPVCTDPHYRRLGLGKEAVLEGLRRVQALGAEYALVGSDQQFYYSIGLEPYIEGTFWVR